MPEANNPQQNRVGDSQSSVKPSAPSSGIRNAESSQGGGGKVPAPKTPTNKKS